MQSMKIDNAVVGRAKVAIGRPHGRGLQAVILAALVLSAFALTILGQHAYAGEETTLTGIIKSVNLATGIVYVDVLSKTCPGMKVFKADKPDILAELINERITFHLDHTGCRDTAIHTILVSRGIRK